MFDLDLRALEQLRQGLAYGGQAVVGSRLTVTSCWRALLRHRHVITYFFQHCRGEAGLLQELPHGFVAVLFGLEVGPGCVGDQADAMAVGESDPEEETGSMESEIEQKTIDEFGRS